MGSSSRARRALAAVAAALALAGGVAACGGEDGSSAEVMDETTSAPPETTARPEATAPATSVTTGPAAGEAPITPATTPSTPASEPGTTVAPPAALQVPIVAELVARLPDLPGYTRDVSDDDSFDPRQCDGSPVPVIPQGQAEADYLGGESDLVMGAVLLPTEAEAALYLAGFVASLVACDGADGEASPPEALGGLGEEAVSVEVITAGEVASILVTRQGPVVWYSLQGIEGGFDALDPVIVDAFQQAVQG